MIKKFYLSLALFSGLGVYAGHDKMIENWQAAKDSAYQAGKQGKIKTVQSLAAQYKKLSGASDGTVYWWALEGAYACQNGPLIELILKEAKKSFGKKFYKVLKGKFRLTMRPII